MIIFDCDGVLVDSEVLAVEAELSFLARVGLSYERDAYLNRFIGLAHRDWHAGVAADHRERFGAPPPPGFFSDLDAHVWNAVEADLRAVPGAHTAVAARSPRCVASSSGQEGLERKLELTGLATLFDGAVFSAEAVTHGKPAPDLFLHAAAEMGVDPGGCTVIEDSVHGVRAGRAAGMRVIGFTGGGHCPPGHAAVLAEAGADAVVDGHDALVEMIGRPTGAGPHGGGEPG